MSPTIELTIRLAAFTGVFLAMAVWELLAPRRRWAVGRTPRWPSNLGMVVVDALVVRLLIPTTAVGVALIASDRGFGLFHLLGWPGWLAGLLGFVVLDLVIYAQHVVLHATSMFNHSNAAMPPWLDRVVRLFVVTPDMHRVHHSAVKAETDSNFGFNVPWWDWLFGTYRAEPAAGHDGVTIGLPIFRDRRELRLDRLLTQPFRAPAEIDRSSTAPMTEVQS